MIYDSAKRKHPAIEELITLYRYRDLIYQLVRRDIVARYKRSVLGVAWTMLNPLGTMLIMYIVFSHVFASEENYAAYILTGILTWTMFSQSTSMAMSSMVGGSSLLQQIYMPRSAFVVSTILASLVNFVLSLVPLVVILLLTGVPIRLPFLLLPIYLLLLLCFSLGVALMLSTVAVFFPDFVDFYPVILMAWMWLSPIMMPLEFYREIMNGLLLYINPFYYVMNLFRLLVMDGVFPHFRTWAAVSFICITTLLIGWYAFSRKADSFAYYV